MLRTPFATFALACAALCFSPVALAADKDKDSTASDDDKDTKSDKDKDEDENKDQGKGKAKKAEHAAEPEAEEDAPEPKMQYGVGFFGYMGASFLDKTSDKMVTVPDGRQLQWDSYPGFGGFAAGGGLMAEARFLGIVGLEIDFYRSSDKGKGDVTYNGFKSKTVIGQSAWHLPLLVKATVPLPLVRPQVFLGPEFVFPGTATATIDPATFYTVSADASGYTMFTAGLGFEIKLPIPKVDIRIPVSFRGSYNLGTSSKLDDRMKLEGNAVGANAFQPTHVTYKSEWKYHTGATLGVSIFFH